MKRLVIVSVLFVLYCVAKPASAQQYYGMVGTVSEFEYHPETGTVTYTNNIPEMERHGINLDKIVIMDTPPEGYTAETESLEYHLLTARVLADVLKDYRGQQKILLDLMHTFFENREDGSYPCEDYAYDDGQTPVVETRDFLYRNGTKPDPQRFKAFVDTVNANLDYELTDSDFAVISVHPEARCVSEADVVGAVDLVRQKFPYVNVAAGYVIPIDRPPEDLQGHALNYVGPDGDGMFPTEVDRIISWGYGVMDPANDLDPKNYDTTFTGYYEEFVDKMYPHQKVIWVTDGHWLGWRHSAAQGMNWVQGIDLAQCAVNTCDWLPSKSDRIVGHVVHLYATPSPAEGYFTVPRMPQSLLDAHANVSNGICRLRHRLHVSDSFVVEGTEAPTPLNGRMTEIGDAQWIAPELEIVGARGVVTSRVDDSHPIGVVHLGDGESEIILTADVNPQATFQGWAAVGFSANHNLAWPTAGQVWMWLKPDGKYRVLANGDTYSVTKGTPTAQYFKLNDFNRIQLHYQTISRRVSLRINGHLELPLTAIPASIGALNTEYAGFSALWDIAGETKFDNFEIKFGRQVPVFTGSDRP